MLVRTSRYARANGFPHQGPARLASKGLSTLMLFTMSLLGHMHLYTCLCADLLVCC